MKARGASGNPVLGNDPPEERLPFPPDDVESDDVESELVSAVSLVDPPADPEPSEPLEAEPDPPPELPPEDPDPD